MTISREPNGSRTDRTTREALAELGASVLVILRKYPPGAPQTHSSLVADCIARAARSLGLLGEEVPQCAGPGGAAARGYRLEIIDAYGYWVSPYGATFARRQECYEAAARDGWREWRMVSVDVGTVYYQWSSKDEEVPQ